MRIMTEPKNSIYNQFREILPNEGVELVIEPAVFAQIADLAIEYKIGARSLRGIFEEMITPVLYVVPDSPEVAKVVIRRCSRRRFSPEWDGHRRLFDTPIRYAALEF